MEIKAPDGLTMQTISTQKPPLFGDTGACCASATPSCACSPESYQDTKKSAQTKEMAIDFLYLDLNTCERCIATSCTLDEALHTLAPAFQAMNYTVHVNKVNITTKELAVQYRFVSSPTIRVNGMDICTELKESDCKDCGDICGDSVDCRVFVYEGNEYEQPPAAAIIDGILHALYGAPAQMEQKSYDLPENLINYFNSLQGDRPMKETKSSEPCCGKNNAEPLCSCLSEERDGGIAVGQKTLKAAICLVVLLAVVSIVGYRTINTGNNSRTVPNDRAAFTFGQLASANTSSQANTVQVEQKLEDLKSLNELNTVAVDKDAVFIFVPDSGNTLMDDTTKTSIHEVQQGLRGRNITVGLYALLRDAPDYAEIAKQVKLPAILVVNKGAGVVAIPGNNVNPAMLLQAYMACCDSGSGSSSCCPPK